MYRYTKIVFLSLIISQFILFSCTKEEECLEGTVRFSNISENPYDLFIDGEFQMKLNGNAFTEIKLLEGKHMGRVEQVSGYLLFPTIVERELNVFGCQESQWIFP